MRAHLTALLLATSLAPAGALEVTLTRTGAGQVSQAVVETADYRLLVDAGKGARIMSLRDKRAGVELVQSDESGLGGLFEDRPLFSGVEYNCVPTRSTNRELVLRCAVNRDGVNLVKTYTFTEGRPCFAVRYEIENTTQLPFKLWIRNFANPGGGPVTEADHGFLRNAGKLVDVPMPGTYYRALDAPWAAYVDTEKQSGYFVRCDFDLLDCFYFWNESRIIPTFEWIYQPVPPGQKASTGLVFGLIRGLAGVGNISPGGEAGPVAATEPEARQAPRFAAIPAWKPLEELYQPTAEERARGFIAVVSGVPAPAPRLGRIDVDLGRDEADAVPVEVFGLAEESRLRLSLTGSLGAATSLLSEQGGWLTPQPELVVPRGRAGRFWLKLTSQGLSPGTYEAQVQVASATGGTLPLPVHVTVWNVKLPAQPVIGTQFYAFAPTLSAYDLDEAARKRFLVYMDNLQALHCDSFDWAVAVHQPALRLKVAGTGELLSQWGKQHPDSAVDALPHLDFGYFDLWFEEPVKRGLTRLVAHVPAGNNWREQSLIGAALGHTVTDPNSAASWQVMEWYYRELREYAARKGFTSFWAKVSDEIPQETIPGWLIAARHYRAAGWQPFTTNTGNIARSATLLAQMNQESDAWQVALCLSRDFLDLTRKGATYETRRERITSQWLRYGNGGAQDTWATAVFGPDRPAALVDQVQVWVGGQALKLRGGSGWGNKDRGVAMHYGNYLYLATPDGGDPNAATIEIGYRLRTLRQGGTPAVALEPTDELWYYGGGSYKTPYEAARAYPWRVVAFDMVGYGWWTYLWWNKEDILVKLDPQSYALTLSAAWEGLRDGNEDAAYFRLAERKLKQAGQSEALARLRKVFGYDATAVLRMGEVKREIYAWDDFLNPTVAAYNCAKREALAVLAGP